MIVRGGGGGGMYPPLNEALSTSIMFLSSRYPVCDRGFVTPTCRPFNPARVWTHDRLESTDSAELTPTVVRPADRSVRSRLHRFKITGGPHGRRNLHPRLRLYGKQKYNGYGGFIPAASFLEGETK
jgi:hypothetical protein